MYVWFSHSFVYLMQHIEASLGSTIKGQLDKTDSGVIYTESYVARYQYIERQSSPCTLSKPLVKHSNVGSKRGRC